MAFFQALNVSLLRVGTVVLRSINFVITPPSVSTSSESGVTEQKIPLFASYHKRHAHSSQKDTHRSRGCLRSYKLVFLPIHCSAPMLILTYVQRTATSDKGRCSCFTNHRHCTEPSYQLSASVSHGLHRRFYVQPEPLSETGTGNPSASMRRASRSTLIAAFTSPSMTNPHCKQQYATFLRSLRHFPCFLLRAGTTKRSDSARLTLPKPRLYLFLFRIF